jgi:Fe2+ transport system protein B
MKQTMKNIWEYTKHPLAGIGIGLGLLVVVFAVIAGLGSGAVLFVENLQWLLDTPETATKWDKIGKLYLTGFGIAIILYMKAMVLVLFNSIIK